jgi:hypothetical protein
MVLISLGAKMVVYVLPVVQVYAGAMIKDEGEPAARR